MPIYIVRWPSFSVSLVRARDEEELQDLLDEVADPGGCRWEIYDGPLWIDMDLPVRVQESLADVVPGAPSHIHFKGVSRLVKDDDLAYKVSQGVRLTAPQFDHA